MAVSKTVRKSIERASISFKLDDGTEAGEVIIENERLKSTIQFMNQKLRVGKDYIVTLENKIEGFQLAINGMNKLHDEEL